MGEYEYLLRLLIAAFFGGIIGFERSETNHAAGLRTHIILCLGAASIMVVSQCVCDEYKIPSELLRMGAQIVSGVGFLGAGSIILDDSRNKIRGITTAAGLWTTACLGIVVGSGYYLIATTMLFIMVVVMWGLKPLGRKLNDQFRVFKVKIVCESVESKEIIKSFENMNAKVRNINIDNRGDEYVYVVDILTVDGKTSEVDIIDSLADIKGQVEIART